MPADRVVGSVVVPHQVLLFGAIVGLGSFVQGVTGFGFALLSVGLLSLVSDVYWAVPIVAVLAPVQVAYNCWLHRAGVSIRETLPVVLAAAATLPIGVTMLYDIPEHFVRPALGVLIIGLTVGPKFVLGTGGRLLGRLPSKLFFGVLAGLVGGATAAPGPIVISYLYASRTNRHQAKSDGQLALTILGTMIFGLHMLRSPEPTAQLLYAAPLVPVVLVATLGGMRVSARLPNREIRVVTDMLLLAVGGYLFFS